MRINLLVYIAAILLSGCSAQKRLNRLIGNHPELAHAQVRDTTFTIAEVDTVYIAESVVDTVFDFKTDTVFTAGNDRVTVEVKKQGEKYRVITRVIADTLILNDTVRFTYRDTVSVFNVQPISTGEVWRYRKQGALWLLILLIIIYLGQLAVRMYLKGQLPFMKM